MPTVNAVRGRVQGPGFQTAPLPYHRRSLFGGSDLGGGGESRLSGGGFGGAGVGLGIGGQLFSTRGVRLAMITRQMVQTKHTVLPLFQQLLIIGSVRGRQF